MEAFTLDQFNDEEEDTNPFTITDDFTFSPSQQLASSKRSCVNSKVRWLMFKAIQLQLQTEEELIAAQWVLCHCHKQLPYDRNWWSRMERQNGELSMKNNDVQKQIESLNITLHHFVKQLVSATASVRKYINGIDPMTNTLRKRDFNASTSLSEWISGDRGLLIKKLANNDPEIRNVKNYLPDCLCEENLKEALHNGGILIYTEQFPSTRIKRAIHNTLSSDFHPKVSSPFKSSSLTPQLNLVRPGAADTRMLDITLMDGSTLPVRRSRCSLGIPAEFVSDPVVIPKICVYDFGNGLNLYIFYRGHKMGRRKRPRFNVAEQSRSLNSAERQIQSHITPPSTTARSFSDNHIIDERGSDGEYQKVEVNKRLCTKDGKTRSKCTTSSLAELLPGVNVPISVKEDFDAIKERYNALMNTRQQHGMVNRIEIRRRGRHSVYHQPHYGDNRYSSFDDDLLSTPLSKFNESGETPAEQQQFDETDKMIQVALSSMHSNNSEDEKQQDNTWNTMRISPLNAISSIPIQSVFVGRDNSTYLFNATLLIRIAQDDVVKPKKAGDLLYLSEQTTADTSTSSSFVSLHQAMSVDGVNLEDTLALSERKLMKNEEIVDKEVKLSDVSVEEAIKDIDNINDHLINGSNKTLGTLDETDHVALGEITTQKLQSSMMDSNSAFFPKPTLDIETAHKLLLVQPPRLDETRSKEDMNELTIKREDMQTSLFALRNNSSPELLYSPKLLSSAAASLSLLTPNSPACQSCRVAVNGTDVDIRDVPLKLMTAELTNVTILAMATNDTSIS